LPFKTTATGQRITLVILEATTYTVQAKDNGANGSCVKFSSGVSAADVNNTPTAATGPSPVDSATGVSLTPTLTWQAVSVATSYDVYFGTSNPPAAAGNVTTPSYTPGVLTGKHPVLLEDCA